MTSQSSPAALSSMAGTLLRKVATPFAGALFLFVGVSGAMLFFEVSESAVKDMHRWLGLIFAIAALFHLMRNWKPFVHLVFLPRTRLFVAVVAAVALAFIASAPPSGANLTRLARAVERAPLSAVAPALGVPVDQLLSRLRTRGIEVSDSSLSLARIAADHHLESRLLVPALLGDPPPRR